MANLLPFVLESSVNLQSIKIEKKCRVFLFFLLTNLSILPALGIQGNSTHLKWRATESENFRFYYDKKLEPLASYAAAIAESVYTAKKQRYNIQLTGKTDFLLRAQLDPLGWARAAMNTMEIGITDWDFPLRSTHNWFQDVIAHEFSHLISIQSGSKWHPSVPGIIFAYQDFYNESRQESFVTLWPSNIQPHWFSEGVAQYESELMGFDRWDAHRDMLLRMAVTHDSLLSYERMGVFTGRDLHYELGPYTQGYSLVRYIAEQYGDHALRQLWMESARIHRMTFSGVLERVLGKDGETLWAEWKRHLLGRYEQQKIALGTLKTGQKRSTLTAFHLHPRWLSDTLVGVLGTQKGERGLYTVRAADSAAKPQWLGKNIKGYYDIRLKDSALVLSTSRYNNKNGEPVLDLELRRWALRTKAPADSGTYTRVRLTHEVNALQPSWHPQGREIVFVREELSNFKLCFLRLDSLSNPIKQANPIDESNDENSDETPITSGKKRKNKIKNTAAGLNDIQCPWPKASEQAQAYGFTVYTPRYNQKGDQVVFSFFDGKYRKLGLWDIQTQKFSALSTGPGNARDPIFTADGKSVIYTSDLTGIFNLYKIPLQDSTGMGYQKLTQVWGGAFSPVPSPDGKYIAYTGFDENDFSLYLMESPQEGVANPVDSQNLATKSLPSPQKSTSVANEQASSPIDQKVKAPVWEPYAFEGQSIPYKGIPSRVLWQPVLAGQEYAGSDSLVTQGERRWSLGTGLFISDPVGKNEVSLGLTLQIGQSLDYLRFSDPVINPGQDLDFFGSWLNRSTPFNLEFNYLYRNLTDFEYLKSYETGVLTVQKQNYAIGITQGAVEIGYNFFGGDRFDDPLHQTSIALGGALTRYQFNFYELPFEATYYKSFSPYTSARFYLSDIKGTPVAPRGLAGQIRIGQNYAGLIRENSNQETFESDENGAIKTLFRDYRITDFDLGSDWGFGFPGMKKSSVRLSLTLGSIIDWKVQGSKVDTLNSFFERNLLARGYPYLSRRETPVLRGENVLQVSLDYNQVIWPNVYKALGPIFIEDFYGHLFFENSRAWDGKLYKIGGRKTPFQNKYGDKFFPSLGYGIKMNANIFSSYPLTGFIQMARALETVPLDSMGHRKTLSLPTLKWLGIPTGATRIEIGLSLGFYNGLLTNKGMGRSASLANRMSERPKLSRPH